MALDPRLENDCILLGALGSEATLLLMNNAELPWLVLVPNTDKIDWQELDEPFQNRLNQHINALAKWVKNQPSVRKTNIASIGNVVSQMHVHIVGRFPGDYCWPNVVWGSAWTRRHSDESSRAIALKLSQSIPAFTASQEH